MPMPKRVLLLQRLDAIGASLARSGRALALIALGSGGTEQERLDDYSDLDFFAIVEDGCKQDFLAGLDWLAATGPIAYRYRNTVDGYKVLFEDGVFCEFAVFELAELQHIPYAPGRVVWKKPEISGDNLMPVRKHQEAPPHGTEWLLGEALTCLYAGLCRNARGERLAAMRSIQVQAVDRVLELCATIEREAQAVGDPFALERRFERRYPESARALPEFMQGYDRNVRSAQAILAFLESHFPVDPAMKRAILGLCGDGESGESS